MFEKLCWNINTEFDLTVHVLIYHVLKYGECGLWQKSLFGDWKCTSEIFWFLAQVLTAKSLNKLWQDSDVLLWVLSCCELLAKVRVLFWEYLRACVKLECCAEVVTIGYIKNQRNLSNLLLKETMQGTQPDLGISSGIRPPERQSLAVLVPVMWCGTRVSITAWFSLNPYLGTMSVVSFLVWVV